MHVALHQHVAQAQKAPALTVTAGVQQYPGTASGWFQLNC